ncbi:MAG TPA: hypothetical protein VNC40_06060 [Gaiellaceae bacterium]|nr:hypothetical protein [Gaiellaceae bacterium]
MLRKHAVPAVVLALGAITLAVAAVWAISVPTYACDEGVPPPSGWIYAGLLLYAIGLPIVLFFRTLGVDENPRLQWLFVAIALVEGVASVAIAIYLNGKYGHYQCG